MYVASAFHCHTLACLSLPPFALLCELSCCSKLHLIFLRRQAKWQGMSTQDKHPEKPRLSSRPEAEAGSRRVVSLCHYQTWYKWQFFLFFFSFAPACVECFLIKISWSVVFGHWDFTKWYENWIGIQKNRHATLPHLLTWAVVSLCNKYDKINVTDKEETLQINMAGKP